MLNMQKGNDIRGWRSQRWASWRKWTWASWKVKQDLEIREKGGHCRERGQFKLQHSKAHFHRALENPVNTVGALPADRDFNTLRSKISFGSPTLLFDINSGGFLGNSLLAQWLRVSILIAGAPGLIPGQGTKALPFLSLEWKLAFSCPMATAEFSKFASILSTALSQHHLSGFEIAQLEFHHIH